MYLTVINILFMLSLLFSIIINLITTVITGVLMYISFALGILNEKNIKSGCFHVADGGIKHTEVFYGCHGSGDNGGTGGTGSGYTGAYRL